MTHIMYPTTHTWSFSTSRFALDDARSSPMLSTLGLVLRNVREDSNGERRLDFLMTGPDVFLSEDLRCYGRAVLRKGE